MLFNGGVQISDTSFTGFLEILPTAPFFLLLKAEVFLSISLTSVLEKYN